MYEIQQSTNGGTSVDGPLHLARCLGWFSIGLGAAEVLAPNRLSRALGMEGREGLIQGYGWREIATGLAILSTSNPIPWIWGRVAGDALDIATLTGALDESNPKRGNVQVALAAVAAVTAVDVLCAQQLARPANGETVERYFTDRSGFMQPPDQMRGAAEYITPPDMRSPFEAASAS
jgi:hypothetical protein